MTYANVGGKADLAFMLQAAELGQIAQMHRDLEACFPPGTLEPVFSYLSVTELSEYMPTEDDNRQMLIAAGKTGAGERGVPGAVGGTVEEARGIRAIPALPGVAGLGGHGFYPMSKRRDAGDNWYSLDFATRKRLMGGHARVGRKFAGRVSQLITGSTGLDGWEWGVTLMAHQVDAVKEIVY